MKRAAMASAAVLGLAAAGALWLVSRSMVPANVRAFGELVKLAESNNDYTVIAGGDHFDDFAEHPFVLDPARSQPLGTTASGAYQMVRRTWMFARDFGERLPDFSPASQDVAFVRLLRHKVPGQNQMRPEGTGIYELVEAGRFEEAIAALGLEWEAFAKMMQGRYHLTLAQAREVIVANGGVPA